MISLSTYAFINAKLRASISKMLKREIFRELIESPSIQSTQDAFLKTVYSNIIQHPLSSSELQRIEQQLLKIEINYYINILKYLKGNTRDFVSTLLESLELQNLISLLRSWHSQGTLDGIITGKIVFDIPYEKILHSQNLTDIITLLKNTPYAAALNTAKNSIEKSRSLFYGEMYLTIFYYKRVWRQLTLLDEPDQKIATKLLGLEIDIKNLETIYRLKKYYALPPAEIFTLLIPSPESVTETLRTIIHSEQPLKESLKKLNRTAEPLLQTLTSAIKDDEVLFFLQTLLEEIRLEEIKKILRGFPFSLGIILSALTLKRLEIENINKILRGKALNLNEEKLQQIITLIKD